MEPKRLKSISKLLSNYYEALSNDPRYYEPQDYPAGEVRRVQREMTKIDLILKDVIAEMMANPVKSRIPLFTKTKQQTVTQAVEAWCVKLAEAGLLYHLEDDPAEVIEAKTGDRLFTDYECRELRTLIEVFYSWNIDIMECALAALVAINEVKS